MFSWPNQVVSFCLCYVQLFLCLISLFNCLLPVSTSLMICMLMRLYMYICVWLGVAETWSSRCSHFLLTTSAYVWKSSWGMLHFTLHVCVCVLQVHCMLNQTDIHISYLPLAHMFERVVEVCIMHAHSH